MVLPMKKNVTRLGWKFLGKSAPMWLQKLLSSWMVIAALTKTYMLTIGFDAKTTEIVDSTFIFTGGLLAIFFPISGTEEKMVYPPLKRYQKPPRY